MSRFLDRLKASEALTRLQTAQDQLRALRVRLDEELAAARTYLDPDLTPEGLSKARQARTEEVRARFAPHLERLAAQVRADAEQVARFAEEVRPRVPDTALGLQRAQQKWEQARTRLDAGVPLERVLADADTDTLLAVQEWGPSWLEARAYATRPDGSYGEVGVDVDGFRRAVDARLAEVVGDQDAAWGLRAAQDASVAAARVAPSLEYAQALAAGQEPPGGALVAALASLYAGMDASTPGHTAEPAEAATA